MKSIKVILGGIVLILASLFFMGIGILNNGGGPGGHALWLFISGIVVCIFGSFFVRDNTYDCDDEDEEDDDEEDDDEEDGDDEE